MIEVVILLLTIIIVLVSTKVYDTSMCRWIVPTIIYYTPIMSLLNGTMSIIVLPGINSMFVVRHLYKILLGGESDPKRSRECDGGVVSSCMLKALVSTPPKRGMWFIICGRPTRD